MTDNAELSQLDGYVYVSRVAYGEEEVSTEPLKVPNFQGVPVARITTGASYTKNLGNYESAKITVEVSLPCFPVDTEIVRATDFAHTLMSAILDEQVGGIK